MNMNEKTTKKSTAFYIVASVICLVAISFFLLVNVDSSPDEASRVSRMQELAQNVQGKETTVKKKEGEITELVDQYQQKTGTNAPLGFDMMELSREERELLEQHIGNETDVSTRSLLKEILKRKDEIDVLKEKIAEIESFLPAPHIAQKGENHYRIALNFLVNEKGLDEEQAVKTLNRTALFDELAEGFKVWNFYTGEEYGTSVTQGNAVVSPNVFVHRAKKKLVDDRDKAFSERDRLADDMKSLAQKQEDVVGELERVTRENENLVTSVSDLNKQVNSMFYRLGLQKNLKKKGILKSGFLVPTKLKDAAPRHFDCSLDLDSDDQLLISAKELGVQKIKDVVLYPKFYKKGAGYKIFITPNKKYALLTVLDKGRFKSERVVIAVK